MDDGTTGLGDSENFLASIRGCLGVKGLILGSKRSGRKIGTLRIEASRLKGLRCR
jgi:hypothetical protein